MTGEDAKILICCLYLDFLTVCLHLHICDLYLHLLKPFLTLKTTYMLQAGFGYQLGKGDNPAGTTFCKGRRQGENNTLALGMLLTF